VSFAAALCLFGNYAFDAGIVMVSCESEGQGFLVLRRTIPKRTFPRTKCIGRCIEILPLGDAAVSPPELFSLSRERSKGKGVDKTQ
jgi:hypothetical protein